MERSTCYNSIHVMSFVYSLEADWSSGEPPTMHIALVMCDGHFSVADAARV